MHPVHTFLPHFPKIHFNIIFSSTHRSSKWSLPFRFSYNNVECISHLSQTYYMLLDTRDTENMYSGKWVDHLHQMPGVRLSKIISNYCSRGRRDVGRPRKRWTEVEKINSLPPTKASTSQYPTLERNRTG